MGVWLFRAGKLGEHEQKFLKENRIYLTWDDLIKNLKDIKTQEELYKHLIKTYGLQEKDSKKNMTAVNWVSQIWPIAHRMEIGDWVVLPSKFNRTIHFGEILSDYNYDESLGSPYYHYREVKWFALDIPRDNFDQDILYSFGASMTVCKIDRNNAEGRLKDLYKNGWKPSLQNKALDLLVDDTSTSVNIDMNEYIGDRISERIIQRFKGHRMEDLIDELLKAKGFTTFKSPVGPDKGVDILASPDSLGFGSPKICVQVKTTDSLVDRPTLDQLIGTMSNFGADYGLLVSWSGFKDSVRKEIPKQFFKVRLWDSKNIIEEIFSNYDKLSDEIKKEIPLKRVWMLNADE